MASRRPKRGGGNVLVTGDTGPTAPEHDFSKKDVGEGGSEQEREFGTPPASLPGGLRHLVNSETVPAEPVTKPERPYDYHRMHGVQPHDWGQIEKPPDATEERVPHPAPEPKLVDAVPVYMVQRPGQADPIRTLVTEGPYAVASGTVDPVRVANRDSNRSKFWICNEATPSAAGAITPFFRIGSYEDTGINRGLAIPAGTIHDMDAQNGLWLTNQSGTTISVSWGYVTEQDLTEP
jgi:hypothetical protein